MVLSGQSSAPAPAPTLSNNNTSSMYQAHNLSPYELNSIILVLDLQSQHSTVHNNISNSSSVMSSNNVSMENHMNNNNSSSLSNCVSPTSNQSTAVSGRASPTSLKSPHQQQIHNGPGANQKQQITSQANAVSDSSSESMSTLKTIAQEVVNRTNVMVHTPPVSMAQQQQQQQQQQNQSYMDSSSLDSSSTATGQNGLNANINSLINATNMSSNTNMKSSGTNEALIPPLLGVAPLGPSPLQKDHQVQVSHSLDMASAR